MARLSAGFQLSAGGMDSPKTITAGSQLSAGGGGVLSILIMDKVILILYLFQL